MDQSDFIARTCYSILRKDNQLADRVDYDEKFASNAICLDGNYSIAIFDRDSSLGVHLYANETTDNMKREDLNPEAIKKYSAIVDGVGFGRSLDVPESYKQMIDKIKIDRELSFSLEVLLKEKGNLRRRANNREVFARAVYDCAVRPIVDFIISKD